MEELRALLTCPLFQDLSAAAIEPILRVSTVRRYGRGEALFLRGDPATHLYVVVAGQVNDRFITATGQEKIFGTWADGGVLGQPALFAANRTRVVDCVAAAPSTVLAIPREPLVDFLHRHPQAMLRMLELLADDLRAFTFEGLDHAFTAIHDRVARKLVDLAATHGRRSADGVLIGLPLTQAELARMVGASREQVNRALRRLVIDGHVRPECGSYRLLDPDALRSALADSENRVLRPGLGAATRAGD